VRAVHVPAVRVPAVRVPVLRDEVPRDEVPRESVPALAPTPTPTPTPTPLMRGTSQGGDGLATPACPKCGTTMHKRQAIRGKMQGQYYWACARQPQCLGILPCRAEPDGAHYGAALMR
jgi:ssDNA-binding Zn-finger/Zn-ribbon topoisomerase 1